MCKKYKLPTDREILKTIYEMYASEYPKYIEGEVRGVNDPFVPIDIWEIADKLHAQPELIFGRIYYHLNPKYSYDKVTFYIVSFRDENDNEIIKKSIHFPLLSSILAGLNEERLKFFTPITISFLVFLVAASAVFISGYKVFWLGL